MIKVLPFSALKRHLQGEIFTPVDVGAHYELQSATRVMCGSNGNTYRFKTAENAALWLDTNTIKAVKNQITKQSAIDSLIIKNMGAPSDWLAEEIATLQARANGDWAAFHTGEDLLDEWGIIAKGDKGESGGGFIKIEEFNLPIGLNIKTIPLDLSGKTKLSILLIGVSCTATANILINGVYIGVAITGSQALTGVAEFYLDGIMVGTMYHGATSGGGASRYAPQSEVNRQTENLTLTTTAGNFDAGKIIIYAQ